MMTGFLSDGRRYVMRKKNQLERLFLVKKQDHHYAKEKDCMFPVRGKIGKDPTEFNAGVVDIKTIYLPKSMIGKKVFVIIEEVKLPGEYINPNDIEIDWDGEHEE